MPRAERVCGESIVNHDVRVSPAQLVADPYPAPPLRISRRVVVTALTQEDSVKGEPANKRQEAQFVEGKILTRYTSSLDEVFGDLIVGEDGLSFKEKGGIDFQPITVLVPGGEEFPFTFSSKNLQATADGAALTTSTDFNGTYRTPSYRTSNFIDPKGRALTTGVDYPQGLMALGGDYDELESENVKRYIDGTGLMSFSITKIDPETGEFGGVFTAIQPSDSDMGGREIVDVKISGEVFGRLEEA